jgi:hypothetical protein
MAVDGDDIFPQRWVPMPPIRLYAWRNSETSAIVTKEQVTKGFEVATAKVVSSGT